MLMNNFFDKIYCINLDRRTDRWEKCINEFKKHNLNVERFSAKDGKEINLPYPHASELGGTISHLNVIKLAKELNLKNVLILEDDVEFISDLNFKINDIMAQAPQEWDMIYFGGNHVGGYQQINSVFYKIFRSYAIQCYAVNSKCFDTIINYLTEKIDGLLSGSISSDPGAAADFFIADLHPKTNSYVIKPHLCWQKEDFSDIQETTVNYEFLKK